MAGTWNDPDPEDAQEEKRLAWWFVALGIIITLSGLPALAEGKLVGWGCVIAGGCLVIGALVDIYGDDPEDDNL